MGFLESITEKARPPELEEFERVMVIQPHPDDTEIAIGGTIARLSENSEVIYVTVTDGSLGSRDPSITREELTIIRRKEQESAARILGVKRLFWLGFEDGGNYDYIDVRRRLVQLIREYKPQLVLTVDPTLRYEFHPDHIKTGRAASEAVLFYQFPRFENQEIFDIERSVLDIGYFFTSKPNQFVCIDDYRKRKISAIKEHKSQMGEGLDLLLWYLEEKEREQGKRIGCEYAESLRIMPTFALHAFVEGEFI